MYFFICSFIVRFLNITQLAPFPFGKCEQGICGAICLTYLLQEKVFVTYLLQEKVFVKANK